MARAHPLNVLATLDRARTQRYHLAAAAIAGTGFLAGAYNLFAIIFAGRLIGRVYYADETATPGQLPPDAAAALNGAAFCGTFLGQLAFGWLGDRIGRRRAYGWALALMAVFSAASGLSFGREPKAVLATLCLFRFWLGVGVGGSYPLSAAVIAEYANKRTRGAFVAGAHAMQGVGILLGCAVALGVCSVVPEADHVWRAILVAGAAPAALGFYLRTKLPETARYTALVARNPKRAADDMSLVLRTRIQEQEVDVSVGRVDDEWGLFSVQFLKRHGLHLLATSSACFLLSVTYYSQNILQKDLLGKHGWVSPSPAASMGAVQEVARLARAQALIALCGATPGYILSVVLIDVLGRRRLQLAGFVVMTVSLLALAISYDHWTSHPAGFFALYNVTFFFANAGPNATTFVAPAELFPARLRCTCHGVAMAAGKAGAVLGTFGFLSKGADSKYVSGIGARNELFVLAGTNFLGMLMSLFVPETRGASLEVLSKEVVYESIDMFMDSNGE
ncbi:probable inorganic phosphate transporter 1-3 [Panicum virgatum]|uniref:H(+)/Pi cotransporter n=1 Tax=Panicum virgatum TaxID=38727 RepID=A0A8T0Q0K3_PANVG|nr:probable inorganic phosphate transporter 1-3 [Panicum virgatum]KAG2568407.1 hypothetical protein PVAP13_7NG288200 [Panicum virgatum]